ncbi:MAG: non-heme iron oxygenase ferredoxin subunit [Chloroflexi bacterium]|nr:non-heme iron oxygenase ferredoxin subunit [Chloroflexota bacterium]
MAEWVKVSEVGRIQPGTVRVIIPRGERIALCNADGEYYAIDDVCTHDGGPLDQGEVFGDEIECPRHGARFSIKTGEALTLPAVLPVRTYPVKVEGSDILIEL